MTDEPTPVVVPMHQLVLHRLEVLGEVMCSPQEEIVELSVMTLDAMASLNQLQRIEDRDGELSADGQWHREQCLGTLLEVARLFDRAPLQRIANDVYPSDG